MPTLRSKETLLQTVRQWPVEERLAFVQEVLRTVQEETEPERQTTPTLSSALGLAATDRPAPTDEEVARWLDEHRRRLLTA